MTSLGGRRCRQGKALLKMVPRVGFEPTTLSLEVSCSIQLSYQGIRRNVENMFTYFSLFRECVDLALPDQGTSELTAKPRFAWQQKLRLMPMFLLSKLQTVLSLVCNFGRNLRFRNGSGGQDPHEDWCGIPESNWSLKFGKLAY